MLKLNIVGAALVAALLMLSGCAASGTSGAAAAGDKTSFLARERARDARIVSVRATLDDWDGRSETLGPVHRELAALQKQYPQFAPIYLEYARYTLRAGYLGGHGYRAGTLRTAHEMLDRAIHLAPKYAAAYTAMAQLYFDSGEPTFAARMLTQAEALGAKGPWIDVLHGELLQQRGAGADAKRHYRQAISAQPVDRMARVMAYGGLMAIAGEERDRAGCERAYRGLIAAELNNAWDRSSYATILLYVFGDIDAAIKYADEARALNPAMPVQDVLAEALYAKWAAGGKSAQKDFARAKALEPDLGHVMARAGASDALQRLIVALNKRGVSLESKDQHGNTALVTAARVGKTGVVKTLLALGALPNTPGSGGVTPLMYAASRDRDAMVRALLTARAQVNREDNAHRTALWYAANGAAMSAAETLLANGAKVDAVDKSGLTPLMLAAGSGNTALVKLLLRHGANPGLKYDGRHDAADIALLNGHQAIAALLRQGEKSAR